MTPQNPDSASRAMTAAVQHLRTASAGLAAWRSGHDPSHPNRLADLQKMLQTIQAADDLAAGVRRSGANASMMTEYEAVLRATLTEIESLESLLDVERRRLSPRLDAGAREREFRTAYSRALSHH